MTVTVSQSRLVSVVISQTRLAAPQKSIFYVLFQNCVANI